MLWSCISKLFIGHFKYLKYNGFLSFVLRKLNETNTFFLCLVVRDGDYTLEGAVSPIINLSLQLKLLPIEWNNNYKNQLKKPCKWHGLHQRRYGWTEMKEFKMDCDCYYDFWKFVSLTVFQSSFCNVWYNAWETYLFELKWRLAICKSFLWRISVMQTLKTRKDGLGVSGENFFSP